MKPLAEKSIANLKAAAGSLEVNPGDVLRVNCFTSSVEDHIALESLVSGAFLKASVSVVRIARTPANRFVECEGIARLHDRPADPVRLVNPTQAAFAQAAIVTAPRVIFTTTYTAASNNDEGVRQALSDLKHGLDAAGNSLDRAFYIYAYPGSAACWISIAACALNSLTVRAPRPAPTWCLRALAQPDRLSALTRLHRRRVKSTRNSPASLLELVEIREVVLDPELGSRFLYESLDRGAAGERLVMVKLKSRSFIRVALFLVMVKIAGQENGTGFSQLHVKHLMPGRVSVGSLDDYRAVAEYVEILPIEDLRLAILQCNVLGALSNRGTLVRKHRLAFRLLDQPGGANKIVGIGRVIGMIMRESEPGDVLRRAAYSG